MESIEIIIPKTSLFNEVEKTTAYIAAAIIPTEVMPKPYDVIPVTEEKYEMIERFFQEALADIIATTREFFEGREDNNEGVVLRYAIPNNKVLSEVQKTMASFATNYILSRWLLIVHPERSMTYTQEADIQKTEMKQLFYSRKKKPLVGGLSNNIIIQKA